LKKNTRRSLVNPLLNSTSTVSAMAPKVKLTAKTDAERALERRYELLRKKKVEKAARKTQSAGIRSTTKTRVSPEHSGVTRESQHDSAAQRDTKYSSPSNPHPLKSAELISAAAQWHAFAKDKNSCTASARITSRLERDSERMRTSSSTPRAVDDHGGDAKSTQVQSSTPPGALEGKCISAIERTKIILAKEAERKRKTLVGVHVTVDAASVQVAGTGAEKDFGTTQAHVHGDSATPKLHPSTVHSGCDRVMDSNSSRKMPSFKRPAPRGFASPAAKRIQNSTGIPNGHMALEHVRASISEDSSLSEKNVESRQVFVANVPDGCSVEAIAATMYRFGSVEDVRLVENRNFGFVTFADAESAARAIEACRTAATSDGSKSSIMVRGQPISINYAPAEMRDGREDHLHKSDENGEPGILSKIRTTAASLIESSAPHAKGDSRELVCYDDI
jgi:hypothetical protein